MPVIFCETLISTFGFALSLGTVTSMASQLPAGALVDAVRNKSRVAGFSILVFTLSSVAGVHSLKSELNEKNELLSTIQNSNDELRRLREANTSAISAATQDTSAWRLVGL